MVLGNLLSYQQAPTVLVEAWGSVCRDWVGKGALGMKHFTDYGVCLGHPSLFFTSVRFVKSMVIAYFIES